MNRKIIGNILLLSVVIIMVSGLVMFLYPYNKNIASLHTVFGIIISISVFMHIFNNRVIVLNYLKEGKYKSWLIMVGLIILACGIYIGAPFTDLVYNFGNEIRNERSGKEEETANYESIIVRTVNDEFRIDLELKKGAAFKYPLFGAWIEDTLGNYVETLYISKSISGSTFKMVKLVNDKWTPGIVRRPEALPCWAHSRGIKAKDGLFVPLGSAADLDAVSGATPTNNFLIKTGSNLKGLSKFCVKLELNQSFDWNQFYTKDRFPNDSIYSGSGRVGQPSVIYAVEIDKRNLSGKHYHIMEPIGHGHHSGLNGIIYKDLSDITSALQIADRIILSIERTNSKTIVQ